MLHASGSFSYKSAPLMLTLPAIYVWQWPTLQMLPQTHFPVLVCLDMQLSEHGSLAVVDLAASPPAVRGEKSHLAVQRYN